MHKFERVIKLIVAPITLAAVTLVGLRVLAYR